MPAVPGGCGDEARRVGAGRTLLGVVIMVVRARIAGECPSGLWDWLDGYVGRGGFGVVGFDICGGDCGGAGDGVRLRCVGIEDSGGV